MEWLNSQLVRLQNCLQLFWWGLGQCRGRQRFLTYLRADSEPMSEEILVLFWLLKIEKKFQITLMIRKFKELVIYNINE